MSQEGHWECEGHPGQKEFLAYPVMPDRDLELGVIVYADGSCSNRWEDGTAGVPSEVAKMAEEEWEVYCSECSAPATKVVGEYRFEHQIP